LYNYAVTTQLLVGPLHSMKTVLIIFSNLVAVVIVAYAIVSLETQEFAVKLVMPPYATLNIDGAEKVDKKILINAIESLNNQYEYTENLYKKALKLTFRTSKNKFQDL